MISMNNRNVHRYDYLKVVIILIVLWCVKAQSKIFFEIKIPLQTIQFQVLTQISLTHLG
mgnify:CR=1 FL=1